MIFTSYYSRTKELIANGIEPVAVSRGVPKGFQGRRALALAPTWAMLKMSNEDYDAAYEKIISKVDPKAFVEWLGDGNVALMCWEKDINQCHRKRIAEWLTENGYEVKEYSPADSLMDRAF